MLQAGVGSGHLGLFCTWLTSRTLTLKVKSVGMPNARSNVIPAAHTQLHGQQVG